MTIADCVAESFSEFICNSHGSYTVRQIVKEFFPKATDDEIEYIVWARTGYPSFWATLVEVSGLLASGTQDRKKVDVHRYMKILEKCHED